MSKCIGYYTDDPELGDEENFVALPTKFEVCPSCRGRGTTTRHIEPDGGGFTGSEWAEACNDDPDFADNYFSGVYDRPCEECEGKRVVEVLDEGRCTVEQLKRWEEELEQDRLEYQERLWESRMLGEY